MGVVKMQKFHGKLFFLEMGMFSTCMKMHPLLAGQNRQFFSKYFDEVVFHSTISNKKSKLKRCLP